MGTTLRDESSASSTSEECEYGGEFPLPQPPVAQSDNPSGHAFQDVEDFAVGEVSIEPHCVMRSSKQGNRTSHLERDEEEDEIDRVAESLESQAEFLSGEAERYGLKLLMDTP